MKHRRALAAILLTAMLISSAAEAVYAADTRAVTVAAYADRAGEYIIKTVKAPSYGSIGGEWAVIGLARSELEVAEDYFPGYIERLSEYISDNEGVLSARKHTEYSRVILALSSLGLDASDFCGYDLTLPLFDVEATLKQGINGGAYALLALDSADYRSSEAEDPRESYVDALLEAQRIDGGWSLSADDASDVDLTAIVLQALAKYREDDRVEKAIGNALKWLSSVQLADGGFETMGSETTESIAQVIIAMCELGISQDDESFIKNGKAPIDALKSFQTIDGGFLHTAASRSVNKMATEQAFCALTALERLGSRKNSLYLMKDALTIDTEVVKFPTRDKDIKRLEVMYEVKFSDVTESDIGREAIEALAARGIVNGRSQGKFEPDASMTRAEFCTVVVRALGFKTESLELFYDVKETDWFSGYVGRAYSKGIVNGVGANSFAPSGTITREAAALMVARAAKLCGFDTELSSSAVRDVLSQFSDWKSVSDWAKEGLAFCYLKGILDESVIRIEPNEAISRRELSMMLYELLKEAELI